MNEAWISISNVANAPDYQGHWPVLAVAHITHKYPLGPLSLGSLNFNLFQNKIIATCPIQYFNDSDNNEYPQSLGVICMLIATPLYYETIPAQLICDNIPQSEFGLIAGFDLLPVLKTEPFIDKRQLKNTIPI